jgi:hypothetical protein
MRLNRRRCRFQRIGPQKAGSAARGRWLVGNVIKFPDEGRVVRFGRAETDESATVIILPVVRIERNTVAAVEEVEPRTNPPASGGRRSLRRR